MTSHLSHPKYRPDIDGLRAIAVLAVVAFHAFPNWVRGGFIGVDVFFVISGYLISTIIFENLDKGTFSFTEFYSRRIRRIFPALLLVLIACFAFGWFALLADEYKQLGKHIAAGAGFISNFTLWNEAGYFDNSAETKPLLHLWSLGIEEQFYIVWPLLLWFAWNRKFNLLTTTIVVAIASFVLNIKGIKHDMVATFYSPQTRFWELLSGSLLAWVTLYKKDTFANVKLKFDLWLLRIVFSEKQEADGKTLSNVLSFIGLLLLVYGFWRINKELSFPGKWALVPVLGAVLIITAGSKAWVNRTILSNKVAIWFGLISFPLYLWHWPILSFARIIESEVPSRNIRIGAVVLSIALAWLTYKLVERPLRFGNYSKLKVTVLVVLMTIVGYVGYNTYERDGLKFRTVAKGNDVFNYSSHWDGWGRCDIVPNIPNGGCRLLKDSSPIDMLVIGDSHAGHLASGIKHYAPEKNINVSVMLYAGCFPSYPVKIDGVTYFDCADNLIKKALDYGINTQSVKTVILSGYAAIQIQKNRFHESQSLSEAQILNNLIAFEAGLDITFKALVNSGKKIIYVVDNPELLKDPKSCVVRFGRLNCNLRISKQAYLDRNLLYINAINRLKDKYPSIIFINSVEFFCDNDYCYGDKNESLWYATRDHLTPLGSRKFVNSFSNLFQF